MPARLRAPLTASALAAAFLLGAWLADWVAERSVKK